MDDQIARFKARRSKKRLSYYGFALSLFLTLASLGQGFTLSSLISLVLLLPLPLYFGLQSHKFYRKPSLHPLTSNSYSLTPKFSLGEFITQPNWAFRLTLLLFFFTCFITLARVSSAPSLLTMIP
jgi:hypothetical protein